MSRGLKVDRPPAQRVRAEAVASRRSLPNWVVGLQAAVAVAAVGALWAFEPAETPPFAAAPLGDSASTKALVIENGEPVRVSTALGEMVWQRVTGA